jgi:uncharacterized membrane protein (DUF2068 family)
VRPGALLLALAALALALVTPLLAQTPEARFRAANAEARGGDLPRALQAYRELAASGHESASLYWNWGQAAAAHQAYGEALWALLRARELEPSDRALGREIERVRGLAGLDAAELAPEPLDPVRRLSRRLHLDLAAVCLLAGSVLLHGLARRAGGAGLLARGGWAALLAGALLALPPLVAAAARPTAVVVGKGAPLLAAAADSAEPVGTLREGEVVPVLERSAAFLRLQDSSGARGWAREGDVRPLAAPPP